MDATITNQYCAVLSRLADQARSAIRDLDPTNDITFLRLRSKKNEVLLAPGWYIQNYNSDKVPERSRGYISPILPYFWHIFEFQIAISI